MTTIDSIVKELYDIGENTQYTCDLNQSISSDDYRITTDNSGWSTIATITTAGTTGSIVNIPYNGHYVGNGTWTTTIATYPVVLQPGEEAWPIIKDALGIVFIDGNLIKLKTKNGKEVVVGKLTDDDVETIPLEVIAAKKKLLEGSNEEGNV